MSKTELCRPTVILASKWAFYQAGNAGVQLKVEDME